MNPWLILWLAGTATLAGQAGRWMSGLRLLRKQTGAGARRLAHKTGSPRPGDPLPPIWLLVAARDEAAALPALAAALEAQEGAMALRPMLVDDGSRDGTGGLARRLFASWPEAHVLERPARGKLAALAEGLDFILRSAGDEEIVLFTDADCRPRAAWLASHTAAHQEGARLVCGHKVLVMGADALPAARFRRFENALSSLQCALGCALERPPYARGGNWSARVGDLKRCGGLTGLERLRSGDDVHLVRRLVGIGAGKGARFLLDEGSHVDTSENPARPALARQARRRYGKLGELPFGERLRQAALFAALLLQPLLLFGWLAVGSSWWLAPALTLAALILVTRRLLRSGLTLLGEVELAARPLGPAARLALHALRHSALGALFGYQWKDDGDPRSGGQEGTP